MDNKHAQLEVFALAGLLATVSLAVFVHADMSSFLPGPVRLVANQPSLLLNLTSDGPLRYIARQKVTGFPPRPLDGCLSGKTVLLTGATSGVGLETARQVLSLGATTVIIAARNLDRADRVKHQLLNPSGLSDLKHDVNVTVYELEMESLASVDRFIDKLDADGVQVDIAILNAGALSWENARVEDGWTHNIQVNFRSTSYLALRLVPILKRGRSDKSLNTGPRRLVLVSSEGQAWSTYRPPTEDGHKILPPFQESSRENTGKIAPDQEYFTAKLLLSLFARELARRVDAADLTVVTTTPGFCSSGFFSDSKRTLTKLILWSCARSPDHGARLHVHAATCSSDGLSGQYLRDGSPARLPAFAESSEGHRLQARLWDEMAQLASDRRKIPIL